MSIREFLYFLSVSPLACGNLSLFPLYKTGCLRGDHFNRGHCTLDALSDVRGLGGAVTVPGASFVALLLTSLLVVVCGSGVYVCVCVCVCVRACVYGCVYVRVSVCVCVLFA
jgi:hypothetical protein